MMNLRVIPHVSSITTNIVGITGKHMYYVSLYWFGRFGGVSTENDWSMVKSANPSIQKTM
jgi:hypothetical protein